MNSLTRSLARELVPDERVNAVLPGPVDAPMWQDVGASAEEQARDVTRLPVERGRTT